MSLKEARVALQRHARPDKVEILQRFFKTGPGEYAEGDVFIGVTVPQTRAVAKRFRHLDFEALSELLNSPRHEERLLALVILVDQFERAEATKQKRFFDFYFQHIKGINHWDLVDASAPRLVGGYLLERNRAVLHKLARSRNLWERRIAIVATMTFIRRRDFTDCLKICETLMQDDHDLIHKACGWMLREVGKADVKTLERFLARYQRKLPRTALRYAIERFPPARRQAYLAGTKVSGPKT